MDFPYHLIDLTHTLDETIPSWNGRCGFEQKVKLGANKYIAEDVVNLTLLPPTGSFILGASYQDERWHRSSYEAGSAP